VLRFQLDVFLRIPGLSWIAVVLTVGASVQLFRALDREVRASLAQWLPFWDRSDATVTAPTKRAQQIIITGWPALAGIAAVIGQVPICQALALALGDAAAAGVTVLAVYLCGLAIGIWLGGVLAGRRIEVLTW